MLRSANRVLVILGFILVSRGISSSASLPTVRLDRVDTNIVIEFQGLLQHSWAVEGPFTNVAGAISPYIGNTPNNPVGFWRTRDRPFAAAARRIATGQTHSLAIGSDGTLWAWGENAWGQLTKDGYWKQPAPKAIQTNQVWKAVAAGGEHTLALRNDGSLWAWGRNSVGQLGIGFQIHTNGPAPDLSDVPQPVLPGVKWEAIAAGKDHSVGLSEDGTLWVWGYYYGPVPDCCSSFNTQSVPLSILPGFKWNAIAAGDYHTMAIRNDGTLWVWGNNRFGQLGDGTTNNNSTPHPIRPDLKWQAVAAGTYHTVALRDDGSLWAWGEGSSGQLGVGDYKSSLTPRRFSTNNQWTAIAAGGAHSIALQEDGTLWAWGQPLGDGSFYGSPTPTRIVTNRTWLAVAARTAHSLLLSDDGTLWGWKHLYDPILLGAADSISTNTPQAIQPNVKWKKIAGGGDHALGIRDDGSLWLWGSNREGQLGNGNFKDTNVPQPVDPATSWISIAGGGGYSAAIRSDGSLWMCGANGSGQLGNGEFSTTNTHILAWVATNSVWKSIAAGGGHTAAIRSDGTLWTWGLNDRGQLGNGSFTDTNTPQIIQPEWTWREVTAGGYHTVGIRSDGTMWTWGDNTIGQLGVGPIINLFLPNTNTPQAILTNYRWTAVAAGGSHTAALRDDGRLFTWGSNQFGQLGVNTNVWAGITLLVDATVRWKAISAGGQHTIALREDGTLWTWGLNEYYGQLGNGQYTNARTPQPIQTNVTWIAIAGCGESTLAIREDGTLWGWGYNGTGLITLPVPWLPNPVVGGAKWNLPGYY